MSDIAAATAVTPAAAAAPPAKSGVSLWSPGGFFKDLLDIVNPLQHLPIIGSVYRYLTGDEPSGGARIVGDAIYGGPIGFGVSVVSSILLNDAQGHDVGERVLAKVFGPRDAPDSATTAVASATPGPAAFPPTAAAQANPSVAATGAAEPAAAVAPPDQPVAMNQLFRSPNPVAAKANPATPEQAFLAQKALYQRQMMNARGADGTVLNNRPVPLELSGNLLPVMPAGGRLTITPAAIAAAPRGAAATAAAGAATGSTPAPASGAPASPGGNSGAANPIAQKMLDGLAKYEELKKQQTQQVVGPASADGGKVDLSL